MADLARGPAMKKSVHRLWSSADSGLVVPRGYHVGTVKSSSQARLQVEEKAKALERLYISAKVRLPKKSDLSRLIVEAKTFAQLPLTDKTKLFRMLNFDRIADSVLQLEGEPSRVKFLKALVSGSLNLLDRNKSMAKDMLWELELWALLKRRSFRTMLEDPPDIMIDFGSSRVGIACKKLYSEKNVEKILSEAVAQTETSCDFGIVAINIDDLVVPSNEILRAPTSEVALRYIRSLNIRFLRSHERHLRKYLASGRLISSVISTNVIADVEQASVRFNNVRQLIVWTIPGLPSDKDGKLARFYDRLMS